MTNQPELKACPSLFPKEAIPRKKNKKLMHVYDAGSCGTDGHHVALKCAHCGWDNGWDHYYYATISELKRGIPCPKCN